MLEIPLTQGKIALIDDEDYHKISHLKWFAEKNRSNTYYALSHPGYKNRVKVRMHRLIMDCPDGLIVDHIDGNGLNNQKTNLRLATIRQNQQNRHVEKTSIYPGVSWVKNLKKWTAHHQYNGKMLYLGVFVEEIEAFKAYYDSVLAAGETVLGFDYPEGIESKPYKHHKRPVRGINVKDPSRILSFNCITDTEIDGFSKQAVYLCCSGKQKSHHGYAWEYLEGASLNG